MNKNSKLVGLIAEDESDIESIKEFIRRITGKHNIGFKHFIGRGCGKIKRKGDDWAKQLKDRCCKVLILVHDLDENNYTDLYNLISNNLSPFVIKETLILIPIQEMEAWFLSDPKAIRKTFNLKKEPKNFSHPENINSPKEVLARVIEKLSANSKIYLNTKHNVLLAKNTNIQTLKTKCKSFNSFHQFASTKI